MPPKYGLTLRPKAQRPNEQERRRRESERDGTARRSLLAKCEHCALTFHRANKGIERHRAACKHNPEVVLRGRLERLQENSASVSHHMETVLQDVGDAPFPKLSMMPSEDNNWEMQDVYKSEADPRHEDWDMQDLSSPSEPVTDDAGVATANLEVSLEVDDDSRNAEDRPDSSKLQPQAHSSYEQPPTPPRSLEPGEVYVVPHPASNTKPEITSIPGYHLNDNSDRLVEEFTHSAPTASWTRPCFPFKSVAEFEQAELWITHDYSNKLINSEIKLHRRQAEEKGVEPFYSFSSADSVHKTLAEARASANVFEFKKKTFEIEYDRTGIKYEYDVHFRPAMDVVTEMLEDPSLQDSIILYPEQHYMSSSTGADLTRIWTDFHTGKDWWTIQDRIGSDKFVIYVEIYADATSLTGFGNTKSWGVYMWLGNVPRAARHGNSSGRATLLGFLPDVKSLPGKGSKLATHRVQVYQKAMGYIFGSMKHKEITGASFNIRGTVKVGVPVIAVLSMDYEELIRFLTILGSKSGFPCPICLVPRKKQDNFGRRWPRRTTENAVTLLKTAREVKSRKGQKSILRSQSLRNIKSFFLEKIGIHFSIYDAKGPDPTHETDQGIFGQHIWPWILEELNPKQRSELDARFRSIPTFRDVKHFPNGVTELQRVTAYEHRDILLCLGAVLCEIDPPLDQDILPVLRALACVRLLSGLAIQTEETIDKISSLIGNIGTLGKAFAGKYPTLPFAYPKFHSLSHLPGLLKRKGSARNTDTGPGEAQHKQTKKDYKNTNKQPDLVDQQLSRKREERDIILSVRSRIDRWTAAQELQKNLALSSNPSSSSTPGTLPSQRLRLGAPQAALSVKGLLRLHEHSLADGMTNLHAFLKQSLKISWTLEQLKYRTVVPHNALRIRHRCLIENCWKEEILHTSENWRRRGERHDGVLLRGGGGAGFFGELLMLFSLPSDEASEDHLIGLIQPFMPRGRHRYSSYIQVSAQTYTAEFVDLQSCERAALLLPSGDNLSDRLVHDLVDGDMYLRLQSIH